MPNLIAVIALLIGLIATALSIARERELGTFDQLMLSAGSHPYGILIGKLLPPLIIGLVHVTIYVLAALFVFQVPARGSLLLLIPAPCSISLPWSGSAFSSRRSPRPSSKQSSAPSW